MSGDWRTDLETARRARDLTPEQARWDGRWRRWLAIVVRSGRTPNQAVPIAWTRTKAQYGPRPDTPEETK